MLSSVPPAVRRDSPGPRADVLQVSSHSNVASFGAAESGSCLEQGSFFIEGFLQVITVFLLAGAAMHGEVENEKEGESGGARLRCLLLRPDECYLHGRCKIPPVIEDSGIRILGLGSGNQAARSVLVVWC